MNLEEQTVCEILTLIILGSYTQKPILYKKINSIFFLQSSKHNPKFYRVL